MCTHSREKVPSHSKGAPAWTGPPTRGGSEFPIVGNTLAQPGGAPLRIALGESLGCQRTSREWGAVPLLLLNVLVSTKLPSSLAIECVCVCVEGKGAGWGELPALGSASQSGHYFSKMLWGAPR